MATSRTPTSPPSRPLRRTRSTRCSRRTTFRRATPRAVLGWGRNDVRAQEWLDLAKIIQEPASSARRATRTSTTGSRAPTPRSWSARRRTPSGVPARGPESRFDPPSSRSGSGTPVTTTLRGSNQSIQTGYCNFAVPGGTSGPFANTYSGNHDPTCYPPYSAPAAFRSAPSPIRRSSSSRTGAPTTRSTRRSRRPTSRPSSLGAASAIGVGATLAVAGITTALSASFGGAGIASSVSSAIFPFAARVFFEFGAGAVDAASAGADAAAASAALTAGSDRVRRRHRPLLHRLDRTRDRADRPRRRHRRPAPVRAQRRSAGLDARPRLCRATTSGLRRPLRAVHRPEPSPTSTTTARRRARIPAPTRRASAQRPRRPTPSSSSRPRPAGSPRRWPHPRSTAPTRRPRPYDQTYLSGNGWFVATKYPESSSTASGPSGAPGATFESLQFPYTDWSGNHWIAERFVDASGNPEFAVTPLDSSTSTACTNPTVATSPPGQGGLRHEPARRDRAERHQGDGPGGPGLHGRAHARRDGPGEHDDRRGDADPGNGDRPERPRPVVLVARRVPRHLRRHGRRPHRLRGHPVRPARWRRRHPRHDPVGRGHLVHLQRPRALPGDGHGDRQRGVQGGQGVPGRVHGRHDDDARCGLAGQAG